MMLLIPAAGALSDRIGRKPCWWISLDRHLRARRAHVHAGWRRDWSGDRRFHRARRDLPAAAGHDLGGSMMFPGARAVRRDGDLQRRRPRSAAPPGKSLINESVIEATGDPLFPRTT
ncbi:MFS transporter [Pseudonocardia sp. MCCB 268]|nr:MFS transporter [Pseudonocardia cytotoxica]